MYAPLIVPLEFSDISTLGTITPEGWSSIVPLHRMAPDGLFPRQKPGCFALLGGFAG